MAASAIAISSDSSDESVGSPPSRVILFGDIPTVIPSTSVVAPETSTIAPVISSAAPVVETTLVASPTGLCGLVPYSGSDSDSPDEMSSPEHISPLPAISPFLCTDSSEAPDSSDGPPSQDPYVATVARWRSRGSEFQKRNEKEEVSLAYLMVFGCDSYVKVKDVARDKLDAKSVKCTLIGYGSNEMGYRFWDSKGHKVIQSKDVTFNEDSLYRAKAATDSSNLTKPKQKDQVVLEDSLENLTNKSIVAEHGLNSEITQSPEDSEDRASSKEGGFETPQVRRSTRESRAPVRYFPSANYLLMTDNGEPESHSEALSTKESIQWKKAINEEIISLEKNQTWSLVRLPTGKKAL
ncbi:retrovirus-related pol polyprotein from transposon TNT 1-94 [Tanacetum coccineum]